MAEVLEGILDDGAPVNPNQKVVGAGSTRGTAILPDALTAYRAGQNSVELERSELLDGYVAQTREALLTGLRDGVLTPEDLVDAVCQRERVIAQFGRDFSLRKEASTMLREVMRGLLVAAQAGSAQGVEKALQGLGAEPADARMLRLTGSTLIRPEREGIPVTSAQATERAKEQGPAPAVGKEGL